MWKISKYSKVGTRNEKEGLECQDCVYYLEKENIQAITLADGAGEDNYAKVGAQNSCKTLAKLLVDYFEELFDMEKSLVQFNVITNIQSKLYELCERYRVELTKFKSTLLGIAIDNKCNQFIAIHLGDGSIGIKKNGKMVTMSYPENGINKTQTYLTSEHRIGKYIKIYRGNIDDISEFILVSDGWIEKINERGNFVYTELFNNADENQYFDDISFIALNKEN